MTKQENDDNRHRPNVPPLRFRGFTAPWQRKRLGEIGQFKSNGVDKTINQEDQQINLLNYMDVYTQRIVTAENCSTLMQVTAKQRQLRENNILAGDVFFTPSSETPEDIGRVTVIEEDLPNTCYSYHLMRYRPSKGVFFKLFPKYAFSGMEMRRQLVFEAQGVQRFVLSKESFENLTATFPSLAEQEKIGTFFRALDELIAAREYELEKLRQMKAALLDAMFPSDASHEEQPLANSTALSSQLDKYDLQPSEPSTPHTPRLRFRGFTDPWQRMRLEDIGSSYAGLTGKSKKDFGHGEAQYVTYLNVYSNPIASRLGVDSIEVDNKQNEVHKGDILFTISSETPDEVGLSSVWLHEGNTTYLNSFCFGFRPSIELDSYFVASLLRSPMIREEFKLLAQGISRFNISKKKAMEISPLFPSLAEQKQIGAFFRSQDERIATAIEQIDKLKKIKQACLKQMFV